MVVMGDALNIVSSIWIPELKFGSWIIIAMQLSYNQGQNVKDEMHVGLYNFLWLLLNVCLYELENCFFTSVY